MKNFIIFFLIISFLSCESLYITDELLLNEKKTEGVPKSETIILESNNHEIIEKDFGEGKNYFYRAKNNKSETFLFLTCNFDCSEKLFLYKFSDDSNSFAFLTKNSSRIKTKNRLLLFIVNNNLPIKLLDTVKETYKTFRFEGNKFIYTLENGTEKSIILN